MRDERPQIQLRPALDTLTASLACSQSVPNRNATLVSSWSPLRVEAHAVLSRRKMGSIGAMGLRGVRPRLAAIALV